MKQVMQQAVQNAQQNKLKQRVATARRSFFPEGNLQSEAAFHGIQ